MQMTSSTGPYLLIAGGVALTITALASSVFAIFAAAVLWIGLGLWGLRKIDLARFLTPPLLLGAMALVFGTAAALTYRVPVLLVALAFAGLSFWSYQREQPGY